MYLFTFERNYRLEYPNFPITQPPSLSVKDIPRRSFLTPVIPFQFPFNKNQITYFLNGFLIVQVIYFIRQREYSIIQGLHTILEIVSNTFPKVS